MSINHFHFFHPINHQGLSPCLHHFLFQVLSTSFKVFVWTWARISWRQICICLSALPLLSCGRLGRCVRWHPGTEREYFNWQESSRKKYSMFFQNKSDSGFVSLCETLTSQNIVVNQMWNFHWNPHCGSMPNSYIQICPNKAPPCPPSWPYIPPCPPSWPYCGGQRATLSVCHRGIRKVFSNALLLLQLGRKQTYLGHKTAIANIYFFIFLHVTVFIFNSAPV